MTMDKSVLETTRHLPRFSLQEMCLLRIVTTLCNNRQLLGLILKCGFEKDLRYRLWSRNVLGWKEVEAVADELVSQICNYALLKRKMMKFLWPVAHRMMRWKSVYAPSIENKFLLQFYWTDRGRINNTKTARRLVGNKNICIRKRFTLACCVCIEEEIRDIWREMTNKDKNYIYAENRSITRPLLLFWIHIVNASEDLAKYVIGARSCALRLELLEAVKYILGTSGETKVDMTDYDLTDLINEFGHNTHCLEEDEKDLVSSVFFEINEEGQKEIFLNRTLLVLLLLLHSSEYTLCLRLFEERFECLSRYDIIMFLSAVFYTYNLEVVDDDDCGQLFMDVWRLLPAAVRASIGDTNHTAEFLGVLVRDHFPFLLEEGASEKIADRNSGVRQGKWKLLHFLLEEGVTTIPYLKKYERQSSTLLSEMKRSGTITWRNFLLSLYKIRDQIN